MSYGMVGFLGGLIPFLLFAAVFFYVLWGVIRSAVLSALRKHTSEQALVGGHSTTGHSEDQSSTE